MKQKKVNMKKLEKMKKDAIKIVGMIAILTDQFLILLKELKGKEVL